jgi:hypothetical protein
VTAAYSQYKYTRALFPPVQVIQLSEPYAAHCMRKLGPAHWAPLTVLQSTAPGAATVRGWRLALPYWFQYEVSTLLAK